MPDFSRWNFRRSRPLPLAQFPPLLWAAVLGWALPGIPAFVSKKCNLKSLNFSLSNAHLSCQLRIVGTEKAKNEFIFCNKHGGFLNNVKKNCTFLSCWLLLFSRVSFQMCLYITCLDNCKVTVAGFGWIFYRVSFQLSPEMACPSICTVSSVTFAWFFSRMSFYVCPQTACLTKCKVA